MVLNALPISLPSSVSMIVRGAIPLSMKDMTTSECQCAGSATEYLLVLIEVSVTRYFIMDDRYTKGTNGSSNDVRYVCYGGGNKYEVDPNNVDRRPDFGDH